MTTPSQAMFTWGTGWAVACPLIVLAAASTDLSSATVVAGVAPAIALIAIGWPTYITAMATEGRRPRSEAAIWTVAFAGAWMTYAIAMAPDPSIVNNNTTEEILRKGMMGNGQSAFPVEVIYAASVLFVSAVIAATASVLLMTATHGSRSWLQIGWRCAVFSVCASASLLAGCAVLLVAGPLVLMSAGLGSAAGVRPLSFLAPGFVAGMVAGQGIACARRGALGHLPTRRGTEI